MIETLKISGVLTEGKVKNDPLRNQSDCLVQ